MVIRGNNDDSGDKQLQIDQIDTNCYVEERFYADHRA